MRDNTLKELIDLLQSVKDHIVKFEKLIVIPSEEVPEKETKGKKNAN